MTQKKFEKYGVMHAVSCRLRRKKNTGGMGQSEPFKYEQGNTIAVDDVVIIVHVIVYSTVTYSKI